jgi:hypothetical protein
MKTLLASSFALLFQTTLFAQTTMPLPAEAGGHPIVVRRVLSPRPMSFAYLWRGVFKAKNAQGPIRLRIFRGAKSDILRDAKETAIPRGCVRMQSLVVEPNVGDGRITLPFYFGYGWLTPVRNRIQDGVFTFVFEVPEQGWHVSNPGGSIQPVNVQTEALEQYFDGSLSVVVVAPLYRSRNPSEVSAPEQRIARNASQEIQTAVNVSHGGTDARSSPPPPISSLAISCGGITVLPPPYDITLNEIEVKPAVLTASAK